MSKRINILEVQQMSEFWEEINVNVLCEEEKNIFLKRKEAVDLYIKEIPLSIIKEKTGIPASEVIRFVKRCTTTDNEGNMLGYSGILPWKKNGRIQKMDILFERYPSLEKFILGNYFGDKHYTLEKNMNIRTLHSKFLRECLRLGIQEYDFPFTAKDKGYSTLNNYIKKKISQKSELAITREEKNSYQRFMSTGYGSSNNIYPIAPYNIVQLDGHKIDMLYTVETENESGELIPLVATRVWLLAIIDIASRAIIGYSLSPYENYNQYDVLQAIYNSIVPHQMIEFTHKFEMPENGGFPSTAIPDTRWAVFDTIMLDNAKAHLAQNVIDKLVTELKCTVNFGAVGTPETRGIVERFFRTIETKGYHRLPGTTGSNIKDTKRKNPESESIKYNITYKDIEEITEYLIAEYNNTPHTSLENQTPLETLERKVNMAGMIPYIVPYIERNKIEKLTYLTVKRTLRGKYKTGSRPRITYMGATYHAIDTKIPMELVGENVYIEVNPKDISCIKLYDKKGVFIANMIAEGEWGRRAHSIKTRELALKRAKVNKTKNNIFIPHLSELEKELNDGSRKSRRARTQKAIIDKENLVKISKQEAAISTKKNTANDTNSTQRLKEVLNTMSLEEAFKKGLI